MLEGTRPVRDPRAQEARCRLAAACASRGWFKLAQNQRWLKLFSRFLDSPGLRIAFRLRLCAWQSEVKNFIGSTIEELFAFFLNSFELEITIRLPLWTRRDEIYTRNGLDLLIDHQRSGIWLDQWFNLFSWFLGYWDLKLWSVFSCGVVWTRSMQLMQWIWRLIPWSQRFNQINHLTCFCDF